MKTHPTVLVSSLILELGDRCGAPVARDVQTLRARVKAEGLSFLTITLPTYAQELERALERGWLDPRGGFPGFWKLRSGHPAFLQGFLFQVFDRSGKLRPDASVQAIAAIRQISLFLKRVELPCSDGRVAAAIESFRECEETSFSFPEDREDWSDLFAAYEGVGRLLLAEVADLPEDWVSNPPPLVAKHGPGSTRERHTTNSRWALRQWPIRLLECGYTPHFAMFGKEAPVFGAPHKESLAVTLLEPEDEPPVRVVTVPKTLKTPRVIAVEPAAMQFAQQGLSLWLRDLIEHHSVMGGRINFRDQGLNQAYALVGSSDGSSATLDLSEASDRVSLDHVRKLFGTKRTTLKWLEACRSLRAELPGGEVLTLAKYASMGSALTFPVESIVFFTAILASRAVRQRIPLTKSSLPRLAEGVAVYGDDLIVPSCEASDVCEDLEALGFKVNRRKSFWTGQFRESCGVDCFRGREVTPTYLRRMPPSSVRDVPGIVSWVATANLLSKAGLERTARHVRGHVESLLGPLPNSEETSPALGWWAGCSTRSPRRRWNRRLQRWEQRRIVVCSVAKPDPIDGYPAWAKCSRMIRGSQILPDLDLEATRQHGWPVLPADPRHLEASREQRALKLKHAWLPEG